MEAKESTVLVKGIAGLGNRILSLLSAALYAELANRRLVVDWTDAVFGPAGLDETKHVNLLPYLFEVSDDVVWTGSEYPNVGPAIWNGNLRMTAANLLLESFPEKATSFGATKLASANPGRFDYQEQCIVMWSWRERIQPMRRRMRQLEHPLATHNDLEVLRSLREHYLPLHPTVQAMSTRIIGNEKSCSAPVVGLHIRYSDIKAPLEKLVRRAEVAIEESGAKSLVLSTDSEEVEYLVRNQFKDVEVRTAPKEFAETGVPLHYDESCADRILRAREALGDLCALSRCDHLVYASRSSFGIVANIFARDAQKIYDCDRWNMRVQAKRAMQKYVFR